MEYTFFILFEQNGRVWRAVLRVTSMTKTDLNKYLLLTSINLKSGLHTAKRKYIIWLN